MSDESGKAFPRSLLPPSLLTAIYEIISRRQFVSVVEMSNFRTIRTALTVSLIIAVTTQPMETLRAAECCNATDARSSCYATCNCCQFARPKNACHCCVGASGWADESNCHSASRAIDCAASKNSVESQVTPQLHVCLCRISPPSSGQPRQHHRVTKEPLRHELALGTTRPMETRVSSVLRPQRKQRHARGYQRHFSQRVLGSWLI